MNNHNRRSRPNARFLCKFYTYAPTSISDPETDALGQIVQQFSLHSRGLFAKEKPQRPREVKEGDRTVNEQVSILVGAWTKSLASVTDSMFCFIPTLSKVYAVNGNATDPWGDRKKIHIYIVDNVTQDISDLIPGALQ